MKTNAPSRSALQHYKYLEAEELESEERAFWKYVCEKAECYPQQYIPPLHRTSGKPRIHKIVGARLDRRNGIDGQPVPTKLWLFDGSDAGSVTRLPSEAAADSFAGTLLTARFRSKFIVFGEGGRVELRLIATHFARRLAELGYTVDVLMGGSRLKALIIKKGKHRWYLCCWESLSGRPYRELRSFRSLSSSPIPTTSNPASVVFSAAQAVQAWLIEWFGVGLSLTMANTALRAVARSLPAETCKFKPFPLLVSMCRHGGAFRGGLMRGSRYRGPTWLIDINRAYTAALEKPLPWAYCFDKCEKDGIERDGIYVCKIVGRSDLPPVYLAAWNGMEHSLGWHSDPDARGLYAILPLSEVRGLRSLHYTVIPKWGLVYTRTFSLAQFVGTIKSALLRYGPTSPAGRLTKLLGNSVYGKMASAPERRDLRISQARPDDDWDTFVDETGWPVEDLWTRTQTIYQWSQHVDVATEITARVRGQVYETQSMVEASGGRVLGMQTDTLVLDRDPSHILTLDSGEIGAWRMAYADSDGIVVGSNCWSVGDKTICPDNPHPTREDIALLFHDYPIEIQAHKSGSLRPGEPLSIRVVRRITPPGRASPAA